MKRHLDLYRALLLEMEAKGPGLSFWEFAAEGYEDEQVRYHLWLLIEADYIDGTHSRNQQGQGVPENAYADLITEKGQDFLCDIRDEGVWAKTQQRIAEVTGTARVAVVKQVAGEIVSGLY